MRRWLGWLLGAVLLATALVLAISWTAPGPSPGASPGQACAALALPSLPQALGPDEPLVRAAMQAALERWATAHPGSAPLRLGKIWGQEDWAAGEVTASLTGPGGTEGTLVLAYRLDGTWQAVLPDSSAFHRLLAEGPARFLPGGAVDWFAAQHTTQVSDTQGLYYIPYSAGVSVWVSCLDCYPGHFPSVDFYSWGDRTLRAARDGTVVGWRDVGDLCCCQSGCGDCNSYLVLEHGDGEYSVYMHMASGSIPAAYRQVGVSVPRGAIIGQEADVGYTCGSNRPEVGCGPITPIPGQNCGRNTHFEVRDQPFPYGQRLNPRFQDVYEQTNPPTYHVVQDATYVSGNIPVTPTPSPLPTPAALSCPAPAAPAGVYLFSEPRYCGFFSLFRASAPDLSGTATVTEGVHSIHLAGPYTATLYSGPDYSGTAERFLASDPDLADNAVATGTSSLRVEVSSCPLISPGVVLYTAPDYGGACRHFASSDPDLTTSGLDDAARSLRLIGPYSITLYSAPGYSGTAEAFWGGTPDLAGHTISGTVSSLRIAALACNAHAEGVTVFSAPGYSGTCRTLITDTPSLSETLGTTVGSLLLRGPLRVTLYGLPAYSGMAEAFLTDDPDLRDNHISTTASSLRVVEMPCRPWSEGVTLFAGERFGGACATLIADDADLSDEGLAGKVRSVQVRGPYRATLFSGPGYAGPAETFDRSDADLTDNVIFSATSSVQVQAVTCTAGAGGVTLWAQPAYDGPCTTFRADDPDLSNDPIRSGNAFSLRVIGPYTVSLYPAEAFGGTRTVVLGDVPDLRGSAIGTATASLQVGTFSDTTPLWNDARAYALPLPVSQQTVAYVQDIVPATAAPDDPIPSCSGFAGAHTLWYRPLSLGTSILGVRATGPSSVTLALWLEEGNGLRELACAHGSGVNLSSLLLAGGQRTLLEVALADASPQQGLPAGPISLTVRGSGPWSIYLPLVRDSRSGARQQDTGMRAPP